MATMVPYGNFTGLISVLLTIDVASVAANTTAEQDFTLTGLKVGDVIVAINKPSLSAGLGIVNSRVKAADTLSIQFVNATASPIDPAAESYTVVIARPDNATSMANLAF